MRFSSFSRALQRPLKRPNESLVIGLAFQVGGYRWLSPEDAVKGRQPDEHNAIADLIESSPPETPHCFERRVRDLANDLGWS